MASQQIRHRINRGRWRLVFHKKAPQLSSDKLRTGRLRDDYLENVVARKIAGASHEFLRRLIMLAREKTKLLVRRINPITGKGAGRFADVVLGIMIDPECEEFH